MALVSSKLVYCSVVCNPFHLKIYSRSRKFSKKFLKCSYLNRHGMYPVRSYSYDTLLRVFSMMSLREYRKSRDMRFVYITVHGQILHICYLRYCLMYLVYPLDLLKNFIYQCLTHCTIFIPQL